MMTKLEKLVIALTHLAEEATVYLQKMNGKPFQPGLPMGAPPVCETEEQAIESAAAEQAAAQPEAPKKERKPRAPKTTAAPAAAPAPAPTEEELVAARAKEEKASFDRMMEVTKQWVILAKNDTPKDGKAIAMEMLNGPAFNAAKLGDLSHEQRVQWITMVEEWIKGHK